MGFRLTTLSVSCTTGAKDRADQRTQLISCHLPKPIALYYRRRSFTTFAVSSLLRQVSVGESPFAETPDPGGSQNGSTEMRW
jgi:hypothetical protein